MSSMPPSSPESGATGLARVLSAANPLALDLVQRYIGFLKYEIVIVVVVVVVVVVAMALVVVVVVIVVMV